MLQKDHGTVDTAGALDDDNGGATVTGFFRLLDSFALIGIPMSTVLIGWMMQDLSQSVCASMKIQLIFGSLWIARDMSWWIVCWLMGPPAPA